LNKALSDHDQAADTKPTPPPARESGAARADQPAPVSEILQRIRKLTQRAALPDAWSVLKTSPCVRQLKSNRHDLVETLTSDFSIDALLSSRIIVRGADNTLALSPIFGGLKSKFIILRGKDGAPCDVISARGQLSAGKVPLLRYSLSQMPVANGESTPVFVGTSDDDLQVLHALGQPFICAAGITTLSWQQIRQLLTPGKFIYRFTYPQFELTIPAWQIARPRQQPGQSTLRILAFLARIEQESRFSTSKLICAWVPTDCEFMDIKRASRTDLELVRQEFAASLKTSTFSSMEALQYFQDRAEVDYGTARRRLTRAVELSQQIRVPRIPEVRAALDQLISAFRREVIDKLPGPNAIEGDALESMRLLLSRQAIEHWFEKQRLVRDARSILAGEFPHHSGSSDYDEVAEMSRLVDSLTKLKAPRSTASRGSAAERRERLRNVRAQAHRSEAD
jgi:hypothetical protein